jgi:uncharacterized protein YbbC (DUF1343 family)
MELIVRFGKYLFLFKVFLLLFLFGCKSQINIKTGAEQTEEYLFLLKEKRVALVANQTSVINETHLVDTLLSLGINIKKVFAPEHGFRGVADAGEHIKTTKDKKTGLPLISLYGEHKKPNPADLKDIDVVVFDIQDVGVRFYTYISTMHYVMEACAENNKEMIILDRPNPNGNYIDGPVLQEKYKSFVGMHPIPLVHGLTVAELAGMINGEGWLAGKQKCKLTVIKCSNYSHKDLYNLPVKPSPNLPNSLSVYLYPSLGIFEGTSISVGRGTPFPFQVYGHPKMQNKKFSFIPESMLGASNPPHSGKTCFGEDLKIYEESFTLNGGSFILQFLIDTYKNTPDKKDFFLANGFFNLLAGNALLKQQIIEGKTENEIRESWKSEFEEYKKLRSNYLLYKDFE